MIYFRVDDKNRIFDVIDTSDPHVMIGNPVGLVETTLDEIPLVQLVNEDFILLYKWDGENMAKRTEEEIEADRAEASELSTQDKITILKEQLSATDYKIIKCSEASLVGEELPYDIVALHAERQAIRDQINELEGSEA